MDFTDQICCWGIKLFYGSEIKSEIEAGGHHLHADATNLDKTVDDIFQKNQWQQDSWTSVKKAAIKDVLKDSLREQKASLIGSMLNLAQSLKKLTNVEPRLTPESADHLSAKVRKHAGYNVFKPYEISYILRNFSAASTVLAQDKIIDVSPEGRISPKAKLSDDEKRRSNKWIEVFHHNAKSIHKQSKEIHRNFTEHYAKELNITPEEVDNQIYKILNIGISSSILKLSREQIVKAIENKDPEILVKAYQTLEDHYKNPQPINDPYQRRIF
ncbi:MAG: hypothetical protein JSR39_05955 [Verrucomicrobia bacterium]|nr:hypothetical protein [Verrucomicrobiota bacterium]